MFSDYIFVRVNSLFIIELFWITFSLSLVKRRLSYRNLMTFVFHNILWLS